MKTALLLALSTIAVAVDVNPEPGMNLDPQYFNDIRLMVGMPVPVTDARAVGVAYETDWVMSPRVGIQYVHGLAGDRLGAAIAVELAYDYHQGAVSRATGVQTLYGTDETELQTLSLGVMPRVVLRGDYDDPYEWGPGSIQVEIGPVLALGMGVARIGGSPESDPTPVVRFGALIDVIWTDHTSRWQFGLTVGWEKFSAYPDIYDDAKITGSGVTGGLILGRRL